MGEREQPADARPAGELHADTPDDMPKALTPARYLAWLYSTDAQKPVLAALLEIEAEIASGLRPGMEHHVAHARLQWWSEEAARVAEGRPVHPLTRELVKARASADSQFGPSATASGAAPATASDGTSPAASGAAPATASGSSSATASASGSASVSPVIGVAGFVDTAVWDLASATFETRKELTAYCERWAAAMFETAGAPVALGAAVREVELLADLARDAQVGRVRIPLDELDRAGVDTKTLAKLPWPTPLMALLRERHEALRTTIANCVAALARDNQMSLRGLLVWAALTWRLSRRAQRALPNVILPRRYDALADGWQAWRTARRAAAGNLRLR